MRRILVLEVSVGVALFLSLSFLLLACSIFYIIFCSLVLEIRKLKARLSSSVRESLELATSDQIAEEIGRRKSNPIILVKLSNTGILVDCFHVPPAMSVQVLEASADLVRQRIREGLGDEE